jgi:hypothetical protein
VLEVRGEQDEGYLNLQKRQLELQEAEQEDRRQDRRREALNARYQATREEAMDRLRMGPTVPYDVLIREAEERFDKLVDEQGVPATRPRSHPSQSSRRFP